MSDVVILCENLSKQYRIGARQEPYRTLRDSLAHAARAPLRMFTRKVSGAGADGQDTIWALKDVSFEVKRGEVVGIIGRNGAGKSTLLSILSRITEPTEGRARLKGRVGALLEVGTGFNPELTGRENIYLNAAILGMKKAEIDRKFDEIVAFAEVEKFIDTPVKHYSSGMHLRLGFAVAAHLEPDILVIDEVLAVGDAEFQKKCLGKMGEVAQEGRTILFVSHNMTAVRRLCSRSILLDKGEVIANGNTEDVVSAYLTHGQQSQAERVWPELERAPGDAVLRVQRVRVLDDAGRTCYRHDIRRLVRVEVCYRVQQEQRGIVPGIHVYDDQGNCLFMSYDHNHQGWREQKFPPGQYLAICEIPGNFLAEGRFVVSVAVNTEAGQSFCHAFEKDAVGFEVFDPCEGDSVRGSNSNTWGGMLRPMLQWTATEYGK
ncbi:MAG: ABC transporter ATP-binding protein [Lysobacterales bacterium]|nr:MAG: ABC transporter ATP-binding protein [Xanthomonadales bacterium]